MITTIFGQGRSLQSVTQPLAYAAGCTAIMLLLGLPGALTAAELPALDAQDTVVVTADQAWESDTAEVLNFKGNFRLNAPHYYVSSNTAELHGDIDDPTTIIAVGQPVEFWVENDESSERTYGEAERLEYDLANNLIRLTGKAVIRDDQTVMRSDIIEYDTEARRLISTGSGGIEIITQPD